MQVPVDQPRRWQPEELRILELLAKNGFTPRVIATRLGRSVASVTKRLARSELGGRSRPAHTSTRQPTGR